MKFGKQLERHKVSGWDAFYVDYGGLKRSLKQCYGSPKNPEEGGSSEGSRMLAEISSQWLAELEASVERVNDFFTSVADEVEARLVAGQEELAAPSEQWEQLRHHLQSMVAQLHTTLLDLGHFAAANHTAFYKILKKHDKQTGLAASAQLLPQIAREAFYEPGKRRLEELQQRLREFGAQLGMEDLALTRQGPSDHWAVARIAFSLGVISMARVVLAVLSGMEPQIPQYSAEDLAATIPVLRLSFMMNLTAWLAGGCAWVFEHYKINYLFLLDISPDLDVSAMSLLNYASVQTGVWIVLSFCFIADMKFGAVLFTFPRIHRLGWSLAHIYSSSVLILQLAITSNWTSAAHRRLFSRLVVRVASFSLLGGVSFAENVFADFLTSLGRPLKDVAYTLCYFRNWQTLQGREIRIHCKEDGSAWATWALQFVLLLPLLFRIAQCLRRMHDTGDKRRHGLNCGKYFLAIVVSTLAVVPAWFLGLSEFQATVLRALGYFLATVYAASWDLAVDFGLAAETRCCLFPRYSYGLLAALDVLLRSTWLLTYQPDCRAFVGASTFNKECFAFLISTLELIRRGIWATLRIEHEHQSNAGRFRSVCWVPPLDHRRPVQRKLKPVLVALHDTALLPQRYASAPQLDYVTGEAHWCRERASTGLNTFDWPNCADGILKHPSSRSVALRCRNWDV
ncbi:unnamed protein product [Effrenium voratum]|nr:unnamed protein product [Effrenium voratum]